MILKGRGLTRIKSLSIILYGYDKYHYTKHNHILGVKPFLDGFYRHEQTICLQLLFQKALKPI